MSIVCCKIQEKTIDIASDSISVNGFTQSKGGNNFSKLFQINELTIGSVGIAEETSLLRIYCKTRKPRINNEDAILDFMSEFADWKKKKTENYKLDNSYIFICNGKAFNIKNFFVDRKSVV